MTDPAHHIAIVQTYLQQAVLEGDLEILDRLFEPDAVSYGLDSWEPVRGAEGQRDFISQLHSVMGDIHVTIEDIIAADDKVAVRFILSGTTTADTIGPRVGDRFVGRLAIQSHAIYHFVHGRIRDNWTVFEYVSLPIVYQIAGFLALRASDNEEMESSLDEEEDEEMEDLLDEEL